MKVLAINSSPKMDKGNTALILNPFLEGMREAGAEVELLYTKKLKIKPCQGCLSCWIKTPGRCVQTDDMQMVYPRLRADTWVFATPLYVDGMASGMKALLERMMPGAQPFVEMRDNHCRHLYRGKYKLGNKTVLVSTCGFWEMDNFNPLLIHMEAICRNMGREFTGALLRTTGPLLKPMMQMGKAVDDIFEAAKEAGHQLVRDGRMSPEILKTVSRDLIPREDFLQLINQLFQQRIDLARSGKKAYG